MNEPTEADYTVRVSMSEIGDHRNSKTAHYTVMVNQEGVKPCTTQQAVIMLMLGLDSLRDDLTNEEWHECTAILEDSRKSRESVPQA